MLCTYIEFGAKQGNRVNSGLREIITQIKCLVTWFRQCVAGADMLRKLQLDMGKSEGQILRLKQDIATRWNSTFYMLDQFVKLSAHVNNVVIKFPQAPPMLTASQLQEVIEIIALLRPIESTTTETSGSKYITCSKIIPLVHCLESHLDAANPTFEISINLKRKLQEEDHKRFSKIEGVTILATATLLDPRFKKLHFKDPLLCSQAIKNIAFMMRELNEDEGISIAAADNLEVNISQNEKFDLWSHHKQLVATKIHASIMDNTEVPNELTQYFVSPISPLESDPIQEWDKLKVLYPTLHKIAMKYLPVVATSVPSERLFSKAGIIITEKRNRLTGKRLSKLIFLNSITESQWGL
ncbi:zinc finger BED domain-containing protein 4-like [Ischnura elegans]|uniref:zinc finger BED domain-containing protein 4-like n=1 Tax=Ischnura elegans TaxID=197161 RepID=UPI001ED885FB|nr:zinc finger BED domain-containing protein 4-like [Ischnura elegans]